MKQNTISTPKAIDQTDWKLVDTMQDTDIDCSDHPEWSDADFSAATGRYAHKASYKLSVDIPLSLEVVSFFQAMGVGWHERIDDVLLEYVVKQQKQFG